MSLPEKIQHSLLQLEKELSPHNVRVFFKEKTWIEFTHGTKQASFLLTGEHTDVPHSSSSVILPEDQLVRQPEKIAAMVLSKLNGNRTVFARQCELKKLDKSTAETFLTAYHLMGATQSAYNRGLLYKQELVAVASFSKGRKMNRLSEDQRSFELIRFCCKSGITVTGGLTRLVKNFCREKQAGDVMTYVDKQFSDGRSFTAAGFKRLGETASNFFLINKVTYERVPVKDQAATFDTEKFYLTHNSGNIKLVYTPDDKL